MKDLNQGHRYSVDAVVMDALQALNAETLRAVADYASRLPGGEALNSRGASRCIQ